MNENIIFVPFAFTEKAKSGENITVKGNETKTLYLKNAAVALCSAKYYNPACTVALVTNLAEEQIPSSIKHVLGQWGVEIKQIPFDRFVFPKDYRWSLAFYKLCALSHIVEQNTYQKLCYLDTDVYVQQPFDMLWQEANQSILLYDIAERLIDDPYPTFMRQARAFGNQQDILPTHYGGELFVANHSLAEKFVNCEEQIYQQMHEKQFITTVGDEFIVSLAALQMLSNIKNAAGYISRFWTGIHFRFVSPNYKTCPVCILHLPAEKQRGMITLYNRFISKHQIPTPAQVYKICRLSGQPFVDKLARLILLGMNAFLTEAQIRAFKQKMRSLVRRR